MEEGRELPFCVCCELMPTFRSADAQLFYEVIGDGPESFFCIPSR